MGQREPLLGIAIGRKGVGKTYETLDIITQTLKGTVGGAKPRKVLILDVNNEFATVRQDHKNPRFPDIKAISLSRIKEFTHSPTIEARRVTVYKDKSVGGGKMSLKDTQAALGIILENYQGGLLVIEDINKFISDSLPNDLIGSIITQRHVSVDVITHFQSIGKAAHPKLWANCNYLRFHKCDDTVERHKSKFGGPVEHLKILEKMVDIEYEKGNKRFFAYLDKDNGNVKGPFNRTLFRHAIEGYLTDNYGIVTKEINRKHLHSGKAVHPSHQSAVKYLINGLEKRYYGNQV